LSMTFCFFLQEEVHSYLTITYSIYKDLVPKSMPIWVPGLRSASHLDMTYSEVAD